MFRDYSKDSNEFSNYQTYLKVCLKVTTPVFSLVSSRLFSFIGRRAAMTNGDFQSWLEAADSFFLLSRVKTLIQVGVETDKTISPLLHSPVHIYLC